MNLSGSDVTFVFLLININKLPANEVVGRKCNRSFLSVHGGGGRTPMGLLPMMPLISYRPHGTAPPHRHDQVCQAQISVSK